MPERDDSRDEQRRRKLILLASLGALVLSAGCTIPGWLNEPNRVFVNLGFQVLPLVSASAFLAGLCVGLPALCPWTKLPPLGALTFPGMHISLTLAIAHLLTTRPSAMMEPLRAQRQILVWLEPRLWLTALVVEVLFFLTASLLFGRRQPEEPKC